MSIRFELDSPIVIDRRKKKKKKQVGIKEGVAMERHLARAVHRTVKAADRGMKAYRKARKKSAKHGDREVLVDLVPNTMTGAVKTMQGLTLVPIDLMRAFYNRRVMRQMLKVSGRVIDEVLIP